MSTEVVTLLEVDASGATQGVATFNASMDKVQQSIDRATARLVPLTQSLTGTNNAWNRLAAAADPVVKSSQRIAAAQDLATRAVRLGVTTQDDATRTLDLYSAKMNGTSTAHANLSVQAMAAQHSIRSMAEQLALGVPPSQVLTQQLNHLSFAATGPGGLSGAFSEAAGALKSLVSPAALVVGGVVAIGAGIVVAATQWDSGQRQIGLALAGVGKASMATVADINQIGSAFSSVTGLSASEARSVASDLVSTGQIAKQNLGDIVGLTKGYAIITQQSIGSAGKTLAELFSDPARGAQQLAEQLGSISAATQRQIANLQAQNRLVEAQAVLVKATADGVKNADDNTSFWSKAWTSVTNLLSGAADATGRVAAEMGDAGRQAMLMQDGADNGFKAVSADAEQARLKLVDMAKAAADAKLNLELIRLAPTVMQFLPDASALDKLKNESAAIGSAVGNPDLLTKLGITPEQAARAKGIIDDLVSHYRTSFEQLQAQTAISLQAVTAFSPAAKAAVAQLQEMERVRAATDLSPEQKLAAGQMAYSVALKQSSVALSEQARERLFAATQATQTSQLDLSLVGASIEAQARLKGELQARQQLEADAARNRVPVNQQELAALYAQVDVQAKLKQAIAEKSAQSNADFALQTVGLTGVEKSIADVQHSLHGDAWQQFTNDGLSATMRLTDSLQGLQDDALKFGKDFASGLIQGKSLMDSLGSAATNLATTLANKALDNLFNGNLLMAGIDAVGAGVAAPIGSKALKRNQQRRARAAWASIAKEAA